MDRKEKLIAILTDYVSLATDATLSADAQEILTHLQATPGADIIPPNGPPGGTE